MEIVTKAKKSCTAFEKPCPRKPGRGRLPKKGAAVHLKELFVSRKEQFQEMEIEIYGKKETIRYYCIDLLWGQKLYQEPKSGPGNRDAYEYVMHCHRDTPKHLHLFAWESAFRSVALSEDSFQRKGIRSGSHGSHAEIFFPVYGKTAGIAYNANN